MKLLIQPEDGIKPLVGAIKHARKSVDVVIFRFDRAEIEAALKAAAERGVQVSALITHANEGGEKSLRKLEMRLLDAGVKVSRTDDNLVRYHDKLLIIDRRVLYVMSFNFTHLDVDHSRGFAIVTKKKKLVEEALKLVAADSDRTKYEAGEDDFVVSPVNAREQLLALIQRAEKSILIYDPKIADAEMLRALNDRAKKGVEVRIIGSLGRKSKHLDVRLLGGFRLHTRTIVRDGCEAFVGSQSLRKAELNSRREVGVIVRGPKIVSRIADTFEADWSAKDTIVSVETTDAARRKLKKSLKANMEKLSPLDPVVKEAIQEVVSKTDGSATLNTKEMKDTVEKAVKEAVRERVQEMLIESSEP